jgi:exosome complex component RRP42
MEERYALELIEKGKRIDERKFNEFREIEINKGVIKTAEGSAWVKFGETQVIAGVKLNLGEPFPDTPEEGVLIVNAEFTPLASPDFEYGPPGEDAIELARIVDRGIRESKCIDMNKLVITPGEKVWCVFVDIHMINNKGNLLDASFLASMAALLNAKIPKIKDEKIVRGEYERDLPVVHKPINISVCKIGSNFILDPLLQEENILDSRLSLALKEDDKICAIQKQGNHGIKFEDIQTMVDMAIKKSKEIRELIG